jgi:hypothetical protein
MNFPNWFRIAWWALLFLTVGAFLWHRFPALAAGAATPADVVIFLVCVALGLAPVFKEVSLFGVGLKQEMKDLRADLHGLRAEIRSSIDIRNQYSPTVNVLPTLPPEQLQRLANEVKQRAEKLAAPGRPSGLAEREIRAVSDDAVFLFRARFALERLLRRYYRRKVGPLPDDRPIPVSRLTRALVEAGTLDPDDATAAEELYRIASRAMHTGDVSHEQLRFAREVADWLIAELSANEALL